MRKEIGHGSDVQSVCQDCETGSRSVRGDHKSRRTVALLHDRGAKGRLETGSTVTWDFHDFPGAFPVWVVEVVPEKRIILQWEAGDEPPSNANEANASGRYKTTVTITLEPLDDGQRTLVSISEEGWRETEAGLKSSYGNCQGWMQMLCALKAYKEHGINLRDGMFK